MARRWKKLELTYLKRYAAKRTVRELAERFRTDTKTVAAKLGEMGLAAKDSVVKIKLEHDPLIKVYEKAVKALQRGEWKTAGNEFERLLAESDRPQLRARARQYRNLCAERQAKSGAKGAAADAFLEAVYERNEGRFAAALAICARGGRQSKDERFAYLAAALHALLEDRESALKFLTLAIEMNPKNRVHAYYDRDFDALREEPEFASLFQPS